MKGFVVVPAATGRGAGFSSVRRAAAAVAIHLYSLIFASSVLAAVGGGAVGMGPDLAPGGATEQGLPAPKEVSPEATRLVLDTLGRFPVWFEPNKGQAEEVWATHVARSRAFRAMIGPDRVRMVIDAPVRQGQGIADLPESLGDAAVVSWEFVGANPAARVSHGAEYPLRVGYIVGNDPERWSNDLPTWREIRFHDVWPGIDLVWKGDGEGIRYDFVVAPGADPSVIRIAIRSEAEAELEEGGDLRIGTALGPVRHRAPVAFQGEEDGAREAVQARFDLVGKEVRFALGDYDRSRVLVIDPTVVFSTTHVDLAAGGGSVTATGIGYLNNGDAYVAGTWGLGGGAVASFVMQVTPAGSWAAQGGTARLVLIWGGSASTRIFDMAVNPNNTDRQIFLTGVTNETSFPTRFPAQATYGGGTFDAFAMVLNQNLSSEYSTFVGGTGTDFGIAADFIGQSIVIAGLTSSSTGFPLVNAIDSTFGGGDADAFVTRAGANSFSFSTYLGDSGYDYAMDIAALQDGDIHVVGGTSSSTWPVVPSSGNPPFACSGTSVDAFITRLSTVTPGVVWSTCYGGSGFDGATGVALAPNGDVLVAGGTNSTDFPVSNAFQPTYGGGASDAFVLGLSPTGTALRFATYLGGSGDEGLADPTVGLLHIDVAANDLGNVYVAGVTRVASGPNDFPTVRALSSPPSPLGGRDLFVSKFVPSGASLLYSTLFGGSGDETMWNLAVDANRNAVLVGGSTSEGTFPLVQGGYLGRESNCSDGIDNDGNGLIDCNDPDCNHPGGPCEICGDGIDNNPANGAGFDCTDEMCVMNGMCSDGIGGGDVDSYIVSIGDDICDETDCSDGNACTQDICDPATGACSNPPLVCDDGQFCNGVETCNVMTGCVPGTPPVIDDGVDCTIDVCNEALDIVTNTPDDTFCDDGVFCNGTEICDPTSGCQASTAPRDCDDGIPCTIDSCNESGATCEHSPDDSLCDDFESCTNDTCNASFGCVFTPRTGSCDDGLHCNGTDTCVSGVCEHSGDPCAGMGPCVVCREDTASCEDTDPDLDLICADQDNCPNKFNPDQRNFDCPDPNFFLLGGCADPALVPPGRRGCCDGGDVCDACPANNNQDICDHSLSGGESIGPAGGSFTLGGCITVDVPPGALASHTSISVSTGRDASDNPSVDVAKPFKIKAAGGASVHKVTMLPDGQQFAVPVTLTFCWDDRDNDDIVDRGLCIDNTNTGCTEIGSFTCDANGDCACGRCQNGGNLSENNILLRRDGTNFDYAGFGGPLPGSVRKCGDLEHQNPAICSSTPMHTANCSDAPGTGQATIALCCDKAGNNWPFETCSFSEMYLGELAGALVPGGGSPVSDCLVEWSVLNPFNQPEFDKKGFLNGRQTCRDGDATCDGDGEVNGECLFRVGACFAVEDRRLANKKTDEPLCAHEADIASFTLKLPKNDDKRPVDQANFTALRDAVVAIDASASVGGDRSEVVSFLPALDADGGCTDMVGLRVPLKGKGANKPGKAKIKAIVLSAEGPSGKAVKDVDKLTLTCLPPQF